MNAEPEVPHTPVIWLWGDSLSAPVFDDEGEDYSWPAQVARYWKCAFCRQARGGLQLTEVVIPPYATAATPAKREPDILCLALGTNDALKGVSPEDFAAAVQEPLMAMKRSREDSEAAGDSLRCDVLLPPRYSHDPGMLKLMLPIRKELVAASQEHGIGLLNVPWTMPGKGKPYAELTDSWHPNSRLSFMQACRMAQLWGLESRQDNRASQGAGQGRGKGKG